MRRRALLRYAVGTVGITSLAGCSTKAESSRATLGRILLRADTEQSEQVHLTLVYAPRDDSTERPVWGSYTVPASGETISIEDFEQRPGFYSLTAVSVNHNNYEVESFNSYGDAVSGTELQFEVVIKRSGDVWLNINDAGESISIPGY